ncbi:MAG: hypothetical protein ACJAXM_001291 [Arenicella sp.]|jgi:hypothetical protein
MPLRIGLGDTLASPPNKPKNSASINDSIATSTVIMAPIRIDGRILEDLT